MQGIILFVSKWQLYHSEKGGKQQYKTSSQKKKIYIYIYIKPSKYFDKNANLRGKRKLISNLEKK